VTSLHHLPLNLDPETRQCQAIIETTRGQRTKLKWDPAAGTWKLAHVLPRGMEFPYDFGFLPSTQAPDGDPLDVLVIMDAESTAGCLLDVRLIGVIEAEQTENGKTVRNDRILAVAVESQDFREIETLSDLGDSLVRQLGDFFINYNRARGKQFRILANQGPGAAVALIQASQKK